MSNYEKIQNYYLKKGALASYQEYVTGGSSCWYLLKYEILINVVTGFPGALGFVLRKVFFPILLSHCGKGVVWGKDMVIRYPRKIRIGYQCIFDDGCVLDAKGRTNQGIVIGNSCMIGRHSILGCKNSDIRIGDQVGIGAHCIINAVDSSPVTIEDNVVIGPMVYLAAGGNYHYDRLDIPIGQQGIDCKGGIGVGKNSWIGAGTVILDGVTIGHDAIIGAGSLVSRDIPPFSMAVGNPAKITKMRNE